MKRSLLAVSFSTLILAGCGGPSLAGDYDVSGGTLPAGQKAVATFSGSNVNVKLDLTLPGAGGALKMDLGGTYTLAGDKLDMSITTVKIDEASIPPQLKALIAANKGQADAMKFKTTGTIKFDGDTATYTAKDDKGQDASMTFTKVKS